MAKFEPIICYRGNQIIHGYEATLLADICDAILEARKAKNYFQMNRKIHQRNQLYHLFLKDQSTSLIYSIQDIWILKNKYYISETIP